MATVSPVMDDRGNVLDFQVDTGNRPTGNVTPDHDFIQDSQGNYKHIFQDVTIESDLDDTGNRFHDGEYLQALTQINPDLKAATEWAKTSELVDDDFVRQWDVALNCEDLDVLNQMTEKLLELYRSNQDAPQVIDEDDHRQASIDEWYEELPDDFIEGTIEHLQDTEFSAQQAGEMDALAHTYDEGSVHRAILEVGQDVYNGSISMSEAIIEISDAYGEPAAIAAYLELHSLLNHG